MELERIIELVAPGWALKRAQKRIYLEQAKRIYDAATQSNYRRRPRDTRSADAVMTHANTVLRQWARHLDENHDLVIGVLDSLVNHIVGTGVLVEPMVKTRGGQLHERANKQIRKLWKDFCKKPEVTGEMSFHEVQRLACRSWLRDGEILSRDIMGRGPGAIDHMTRVPYSIELIEADFLPYEKLSDTPLIVHGVEKNDWGRPVAYHLLKRHPGNLHYPVVTLNLETVRVPAEGMIHLKFTRRFHQTRGVTILHGVINRLDDIKDYEESERIAARVAAAFTGYIRKSNEFLQANQADPADRSFEMAPGMIFDNLLPGEDVGTIASNRPNEKLIDFRNSQMRAVAAGTGSSYSSISKDYNGTYSAQRQELVESYPAYNRMRNYFSDTFIRPIYERFLDTAILAGELRLPRSAVDMDSLYDVDMRGPGMPWIDPKKEIEAYALAVQAGFKSRHQIIRDQGGDPAIVDEQIKADTYAARPTDEPTKTPAEENQDDDGNGDGSEDTEDEAA